MRKEYRFEEIWVTTRPQEMFDHVVKKLALQGTRARRGIDCMIEVDGKRCALGHLLRDDAIQLLKRYDRLALSVRPCVDFLTRPALGPEEAAARKPIISLVSRLQGAHDNTRTRAAAAVLFGEAAEDFGLSRDVVDDYMGPVWQRAPEW